MTYGRRCSDVADRLAERLDRREPLLAVRDVPVWQTNSITMGWPCASFAIHGAGGAMRMAAQRQLRRRRRRELAEHLEHLAPRSARQAIPPPIDLGADRVEP